MSLGATFTDLDFDFPRTVSETLYYVVRVWAFSGTSATQLSFDKFDVDRSYNIIEYN